MVLLRGQNVQCNAKQFEQHHFTFRSDFRLARNRTYPTVCLTFSYRAAEELNYTSVDAEQCRRQFASSTVCIAWIPATIKHAFMLSECAPFMQMHKWYHLIQCCGDSIVCT